MYSSLLSRFGAIFLFAPTIALASVARVHAGEEIFDLADARGKWEQARLIAQSMSGTIRSKTTFTLKPSPDTPDDEGNFEVRQNRDCASIHLAGPTLARSKNAEFMTVINPKYAFQLKRVLGAKEWSIDQVDTDSDGSKIPLAFRSPLRQGAMLFAYENFYILERGLTLGHLTEQPNFHVTKTERVVLDGIDMVRIDFAYPNPVERIKEPGFSSVQGGYIVLDPGHLWCLKEYNVRTSDYRKCSITANYKYDTGPDHFPMPSESRIHKIGYHPDGKEMFNCATETKYEFRYAPSEFEDQEFTLSAFAFPEPYGITWKRTTPRYIWLIAAAGVFAVMGIGLRYLAKRAKSSSTNLLSGEPQ